MFERDLIYVCCSRLLLRDAPWRLKSEGLAASVLTETQEVMSRPRILLKAGCDFRRLKLQINMTGQLIIRRFKFKYVSVIRLKLNFNLVFLQLLNVF